MAYQLANSTGTLPATGTCGFATSQTAINPGNLTTAISDALSWPATANAPVTAMPTRVLRLWEPSVQRQRLYYLGRLGQR